MPHRFTDPWLDFEREHAWHPYAPVPAQVAPLPVASAQGAVIRLTDGTELIDGMSSWWAAIHGYCHPVLNRAAKRQLDRMSHVMFGGLTHQPAAELIRRLVDITPPSLDRVFLCDSGSVSVEVALKMACQYQAAKGQEGRTRFASLSRGYHGDTIGAMSVSDPHNGMHSLFTGLLAHQLHLPAPPMRSLGPFQSSQLDHTETLIAEAADSLAAIIFEPVVQGAGGMRFYHPEYVAGLKDIADRYGLLLIADEIATGFGRTGHLFACDAAGITPDIMCVGKALTGGMMTLAATLATDQVAGAISSAEPGVFMHGPTFMANPLAAAVASASIDLLRSGDWQGQIRRIESSLTTLLEPARNAPGVNDIRVLGAIGVIEMEAPVDMARVTDVLLDMGVWLRPFGNLIYTMPPYIATAEQVERIVEAMRALAGLVRG
ncbi:MAG: adenosylmethionine-8-amino-7-oxononanoate aminotransferase [marine bacterium B5-7]|nr:MAG: adenosylmethionine-8-amino-7-oxononanoate aminotransferase [marine bacterium B5-7]